jgi:predicted dehydrogenase
MDKKQSRRTFIKQSAAAAAVLTIPTIIPAHAFGSNDRIRAAVLGLNGRGKSHVSGLMAQNNVEVVTLCDPDMNILKNSQKSFKEKYNKEVALVQDLRRVYDDKNIDVVGIASPNHWHALSVIWACQAGKDVYVEKPGSHNVWEGRKMVEAANKYDRIVQHGVQLRSSPAINEAIGLLREGYIGQGLHGARSCLPLEAKHRQPSG